EGASGGRSTSEDVVTILPELLLRPGSLAELESGTPAPGAERANSSTGRRAGPIGSTSYSSGSMACILLAPPRTEPGVIRSIPSAQPGNGLSRSGLRPHRGCCQRDYPAGCGWPPISERL